MKKVSWISLFLAVVFALTSCESMVESQLKSRFSDTMERQAALLSSGNMHIVLLGTGGPLANEKRVCSGFAVIAGGEMIILDVGPGVVRNINLEALPLGNISALLLTHYHSDHISDMGELAFMSWAAGRDQKLQVYGPEGVETVVAGYNMAYSLDSSYRVAHHSEEWMPSANAGMVARTLAIPNPEEMVSFFDRNGLKISVFQVDHSPVTPAVGYRFEYKGNVVVFTGDTVKTDTLPQFAKNADLLLSEALNAELISMVSKNAKEMGNLRASKQMRDVIDYHMTPVQAAEIASEAGVKKLVLIHVVPPVTNVITKRMFLKGTGDAFDGDIILGEDRMTFELEAKN